MGKRFTSWLVVVALVAALASAAWAHNLTVTTPNGVKEGWVGALDLPGRGQGLIPGGPGGQWMITPAHAKGLNVACMALEANGNGVVDIRGPGGPGCPHGQ